MVDDRHDDASQEGGRQKRSPPTIDLEATEISRETDSGETAEADKAAADDPSPAAAPAP